MRSSAAEVHSDPAAASPTSSGGEPRAVAPYRAGTWRYDDRHARALERIVQACRNTGKIPGLACPKPEEAKRRAEQGFQFLTAGSDAGFMLAGARAGLQTLGL